MRVQYARENWVAIISEIDCGNLNSVEEEAIYELFAKNKLVIFKNQKLNNEQLKKFADIFGNVWTNNEAGLGQTKDKDKEDGFVELVSDDGLLKKGIIPWHIDLSHHPSEIPNRLLYAVELEGEGAPTKFIDTIQGAKLLDKELHECLTEAVALCKAPYPTPWKDAVRRPALQRHPYHDEYALTFDGLFTETIEGLKQDYKEWFAPILEQLQNEETTYDHYWELGDLMVYDNWSTMHYRPAFEGKRKLKRVTWNQIW